MKYKAIKESIVKRFGLLGWKEEWIEKEKDSIKNELNIKYIKLHSEKGKIKKGSEYYFKILNDIEKNDEILHIVYEWINNLYNKTIERERYTNSKVFNYIILTATLLTLYTTLGVFKITFLTLYSLILLIFLITYKSKRGTEIGSEYILALANASKEKFEKTITIDQLIDIEYLNRRLNLIGKFIRTGEFCLVTVFILSSISQTLPTSNPNNNQNEYYKKSSNTIEIKEQEYGNNKPRTTETTSSSTDTTARSGKKQDTRGNRKKEK